MMDVFNASRVSLVYRLEGSRDKATLLFHHSLGANHRLWDRQVELLSDRYRILRFDCRGHGQSSCPAGPYSVAQLGEDTVELLDYLNLRSVTFCGLSLGSMVGLWLAVNASERIRRLVLVGASANVQDKSGFDRRLAALSEKGLPSIVDELLARWFTPQLVADPSPEIQSICEMVLASPLAGYIAASIAVRDFDCLDLLKEISCPLHLISGDQDLATPLADAQRIKEAVAGATLTVISGASHLAQLEMPEVFDTAFLSCLEQ